MVEVYQKEKKVGGNKGKKERGRGVVKGGGEGGRWSQVKTNHGEKKVDERAVTRKGSRNHKTSAGNRDVVKTVPGTKAEPLKENVWGINQDMQEKYVMSRGK